jgi:hypothetical protein
MDYIDTVFVDLKQRLPGKYPLADLREPLKFIAAVKFLIEGEWLPEVRLSNDYKILSIGAHYPKVQEKRPRKENWYGL